MGLIILRYQENRSRRNQMDLHVNGAGARNLKKGRGGGPEGGDIFPNSTPAARVLWSSTPHNEVDLFTYLLSLHVRFIS
jgi:hypothetical protein